METDLKIISNGMNHGSEVAVNINFEDRSWNKVRKIINKWLADNGNYKLDLRKSSKSKIPLCVVMNCCGDKLEVRRVKDFPLKDLLCKCGNYIIKWNG